MDDSKRLWLKISGSITYYLKDYDIELSNEELLKDYLGYALNEEDGIYQYLDKQTYKYIDLDDKIIKKAKKSFIERLEKRRLKEPKKEIKEVTLIKNNVVSFSKYKSKKHLEEMHFFNEINTFNTIN